MEFAIGPCGPDRLDALLDIQEETFAALEDERLLRRNTPEMLESCLLPPHVTLGAWHGNALAAFSILYFPEGQEDLSLSLAGVERTGLRAANYKLCIVRPAFRGSGLQYRLGLALEWYAKEARVGLLCATVSPRNSHSMENIRKMGYTYNRTLTKYGLERALYYKFLPAEEG